MTPMQLDLLDACATDPVKDAILALIAGDPLHARDREAIVSAIRDSVDQQGMTSSNHWRPLIPAFVYPRVVGATVNALTKAGVLVPTGEWLTSNDVHGRNSGRPVRLYRWTGAS